MSLILKPIITEKTSSLRENSIFVFLVRQDANKIEIMKEFKQIFKVSPKACKIVRTQKLGGRIGRTRVRSASYFVKKAYIHVAKGTKLEGFEGI